MGNGQKFFGIFVRTKIAWTKKVGKWPKKNPFLSTKNPVKSRVCGFFAQKPTFILLLIEKIKKLIYILNISKNNKV